MNASIEVQTKAGWDPLISGVAKINCDGAYLQSSKKAAMGVIVRDGSRNFLRGWRESMEADFVSSLNFWPTLKLFKWPPIFLILTQ